MSETQAIIPSHIRPVVKETGAVPARNGAAADASNAMSAETTYTVHLTDLGRELAAIREEALRRIQLVEGRRIERVKLFEEWRELTTDELVERVEGHADTWLLVEQVGARMPNGLGRWAV